MLKLIVHFRSETNIKNMFQVEPPSNIQPVGTYMNMGYNTEQQDPFQPEHVAIFQPIHPAPSAGVVPNVEENIRSEQSDQPVDHFVSIHPTSFSDLHQDSRTHRNAEDILHSQVSFSFSKIGFTRLLCILYII